ncbi:Lysophospholipase L1 [Chitinophaga terrae (ex Kim and Jung 2007)]|uniref:Lysophospholipase L1 n=1 Tax=Chitinophaga terrae (ex Kim and Jung 2007) TaxID=408074 RepID=A0A1H3Y3K5_9BACT|nr:hypothetical protein CTE07_26010 [Chitinophaga terrae (ex Kim and Jung 2007)]SEA06229.1 Lysophospholipase L1 [Chitinophaga terrae (ex Kim and Jung 2007)]
MSGKNKSAYPFYIVFGTLACLVGLSQLNLNFSFKDFQFRKLDLLSDLRTSENKLPDQKSFTAANKTGGSKHLSPGDSVSTGGSDSLAAANPDSRYDYLSYTGILEYASPEAADNPGLRRFLAALNDLKAGKRSKVRIAYFGDSMIEGDLITADLRDSLQHFFGGAGVGFVPITSVVASFRTTITHTFSKDWKDYHYKNSPPSNVLLGLSGHTFYPGGSSWAKYSPVKKPLLDKFEEVSVLYGPAGNGMVTINDKPYTLTGSRTVNRLDLRQDTGAQSITLVNSGNAVPLYGVCFESENGIYVDNYSFRGISGVELGRLSAAMVRQMQEERHYDLVIMHYGANVLFRPELTDYSWYQKPMTKVLDSLRQDLPGTSFLIVGTADKSYRKADKYVTAPGVEALLKVQHDLAADHGTAYWNLYAAMGGEGSMVKWVEGDTVMANKDYTHFNRTGAAKVGALLYKALMNEYRLAQQP